MKLHRDTHPSRAAAGDTFAARSSCLLRSAAWPLVACAAASVPAQASMFSNAYPGSWPGGRITWYYNPAGRPANITDAEVIAAFTTSFATWQRACGIEASYGGLTTTPAQPTPAGSYVVGWNDFGSAQFLALGSTRSTVTSGNHRPFSGGGVRINTYGNRPQDVRERLDSGSFVGVLNHEIGHSLGLAHSDDPVSIMYANPYNTDDYFLDLQGDDVAACADVYGSRGVVDVPDRRNAVPAPHAYTMQASVLAAPPSATPPAASLSQVDPTSGATYYLATHWANLPPGSQVVRQTVSPYGSLYTVTPAAREAASGFRANVAPGYYRLPFAGRWVLQVLVDRQLAASVPFDVVQGQTTPVAPFEAAIVGELQGGGALRWRVATYGAGAPVQTRVVANGSALEGIAARAQPGSNAVEVWIETDRPRYKPGDGDGQPERSYDVARRALFAAAADGTPLAAPIRVSESGTPTAYAASATLVLTEAAEQGVYVAALVGGTAYFRTAGGWSTQPVPLASARGPAVVTLDVLRNLDVRGVPPGSALYVGYGRTLDEVVSRGQYALVRSF